MYKMIMKLWEYIQQKKDVWKLSKILYIALIHLIPIFLKCQRSNKMKFILFLLIAFIVGFILGAILGSSKFGS